MITLAQARHIADAAFAEGQRRNIANISVVVTGLDGVPCLALRADTQGAFGIDTARAKAETALGFRLSSWKLSQIFGNKPAATAGLHAATRQRFIPIGGAVVVHDAMGQVLGAASISGGNPQADDEIIRVAVEQAGFQAGA